METRHITATDLPWRRVNRCHQHLLPDLKPDDRFFSAQPADSVSPYCPYPQRLYYRSLEKLHHVLAMPSTDLTSHSVSSPVTTVWGDPDPDVKPPPLQASQNAFVQWKLEKIPPGPERQAYLKENFNRYIKGICKTCIRSKARAESYVSRISRVFSLPASSPTAALTFLYVAS